MKSHRQILHAVEHYDVQLLVWVEDDELLWAHRSRIPSLDRAAREPEWIDWGGAYLSTEVNKELTRLWEETK